MALTAASLCFPARWRLSDKLGRPMADIHRLVPGFNAKLARPVDRFFDRVEPDQPYLRANWSVIDDPTLFQPTGHGRGAHDPTITPENAARAAAHPCRAPDLRQPAEVSCWFSVSRRSSIRSRSGRQAGFGASHGGDNPRHAS